MSDTVLQVTDLSTRFSTNDGEVYAVDKVSFTVRRGEMVGLVGESGCGKTTTALSIIRLLPKAGRIAGGSITVNGTDLVRLPENQMRRKRGSEVAMIFQDALSALDPTMRVGEQLCEPLRAHLGMSRPQAMEEAVRLLGLVGIPSPRERLRDYSFQFSGGMRQRVMIAMALSCNPSLLLADEPTTALDVTIQRQILGLMKRLKHESNAGVILVTHDVGVVAEVCDRVVVMYAGRIVESGPTERVFRNPQHPYTIGLLSSSLDFTTDRTGILNTIPGLPPDLVELPPGCFFWPRCKEANDRCKQASPQLLETEPQHRCACFRREEGMDAT